MVSQLAFGPVLRRVLLEALGLLETGLNNHNSVMRAASLLSVSALYVHMPLAFCAV